MFHLWPIKKLVGRGNNYYNINFNEEIKILAYTDDYYFETNLKFTGIPIVNIQSDQEISNVDTLVYSEIIDPYYDERDSEQYIQTNANMHIRGNTSREYDKKAFKYELIKENGENRKKNLLGMRDDDDWVLDALYCDPSNIRNVVGCDLWNEMNSTNTSNDYDINLECEFVEVFINNNYAGIYVLKEPIDAKQVGIEEKTSSELLIKGEGYKVEYKSEETYNSIDNYSRTAYEVYSMKYPKESSNEELISDFTRFLDKVNPYFDYTITEKDLEENYNLNSVIDYSILVSFTNAVDNTTIKNMFFYIDENDKVNFVPWDLDLSFGLFMRFEPLNPVTGTVYVYDYENFDKYCPMYISESFEQYNHTLTERYNYLRKNVLSYENLEKICNNYKNLLMDSGAYDRDRKLYYDYDLEKEISDILSWSKKRIDYLDKCAQNF